MIELRGSPVCVDTTWVLSLNSETVPNIPCLEALLLANFLSVKPHIALSQELKQV